MIADCSLVITTSGGNEALFKTLAAINLSEVMPKEVILVCIDRPVNIPFVLDFELKPLLYPVAPRPCPVAKARNLGASVATGAVLIFLDADCIPAPNLVGELSVCAESNDALCMATSCLMTLEANIGDSHTVLRRKSRVAPGMFALENTSAPLPCEAIVSKAFSVSAKTFDRLGGFDPTFEGMAPYCLDFARSAREADITVVLGKTEAFTQTRDPNVVPIGYFDEILENTWKYFLKWGEWPMKQALISFRAMGFIKWTPDQNTPAEILRRPGAKDFEKQPVHTHAAAYMHGFRSFG